MVGNDVAARSVMTTIKALYYVKLHALGKSKKNTNDGLISR